MDNEPWCRQGRREEIRQRIDAIHTRIGELYAMRQEDAAPAASCERIASAQRRANDSREAAQRALAASARAFRRAAEAHERVAIQHERAATAGLGDKDEHDRQAVVHRAAMLSDIRRADDARSLLHDENTTGPRGPGADQTSTWP